MRGTLLLSVTGALLSACGTAPSAPHDVSMSEPADDAARSSDAPDLDGRRLDATRDDGPTRDAAEVAAPVDAPDVIAAQDVVDASTAPEDAPPADAGPRSFRASYPLLVRFPEGGTYDPRSHRFFVGSLGDGSVRQIDAATGLEEGFYQESATGRWWTLGMDVDVARRRLAVCSMEDRRSLGDSSRPYAGYVLVFDLDTGIRVARHALAGAFDRATCTDVAYAADGTVYVCDREHPRIYQLSPRGALTTFVTNDRLAGGVVGQNAIVVLPDQSALLSLVYLPSRLVRVDLRTRAVADVSIRGDFFDGLPLLSGADGMTLSGDSLIVAFTSQVTRLRPSLGDWSAASATTTDVPEGMTDVVHTPGGDYLLNGQAVAFAFERATTPFQLVRLSEGR